MHKYLITRGVSKYVRRWIEDLESQFLPLKIMGKDGEPAKLGSVQLVARPIQLWELVYPEASDDTVCKLIGIEGYGHHNLKKKVLNFLTKLFGLKKTEPQPDLSNIVPQLARPAVGVHILGNKKDKKDIHGNDML